MFIDKAKLDEDFDRLHRDSNSKQQRSQMIDTSGDYGSAGSLSNTSSSSRAKVMQHQRELQQQKMKDRLGSGGSRSVAANDNQLRRRFSLDDDEDEDDEDYIYNSRPTAKVKTSSRGRKLQSRGQSFDDDDDDEESDEENDDHYQAKVRTKKSSRSRKSSSRHTSSKSKHRFSGEGSDDDGSDASSSTDVTSTRKSSKSKSSKTTKKASKKSKNRRKNDRRASHSSEEETKGGESSDEDAMSCAGETLPQQQQQQQPAQKPPLNIGDLNKFLFKPSRKDYGVVECYVERNRSGANRLFPEYCLYLKNGDRFLMTAKKRPNNKTSNYLISMQRGDLNRRSANYLGKLRSNFIGTEFNIYDGGDDGTCSSSSNARQELGIVMFNTNLWGSRGPRKMKCAVPKVQPDGHRVAWRPKHRDEEMLSKTKEQDHTNLTYLVNKPPKWNEQVGAFVLNFNGRVTMASVKNFQLVTPQDQETVVLQFGRVGKDLFTMDFQYPLCPFQAFAITLSSFDSKLACE